MSILFSQNLLKNNEIRPQEADFTEVLESIALAPKMLYFYGKMPENRLKMDGSGGLERPKTLAIVGTRKPTRYGEGIAYELAKEAAKRGAVVVSGMAFGIDAAAHRGALDGGGVTVAVLGTPIDYIYPRAHRGLAERIIESGGCVMSELAPGAEYFPKTTFLQRNRLISGLADVVVVPEAAERSGSLNTAAHALEQGRDLFVVPGDIQRAMSKGCNKLIKQGAEPYTEVEDVLRVLFPMKKGRKLKQEKLIGDDEVETKILQGLDVGLDDGDEIMDKLGISAAEFSCAMTMLEIKGRVMALGANRWRLV